jgi:hypothetical protein
MLMTGLFRLALLPGVEPETFEAQMRDEILHEFALQATRITSDFDHQLLRADVRQRGDDADRDGHLSQHYVWQATVRLMTDAGYDFERNAERVQEAVAQFAVLIGIESFTNVEGATSEE